MADVDITGLADMSRDEVAALWQKCRTAGDKAREYIVRDHYTKEFGSEPDGVPAAAPADAESSVPEPAADTPSE